MREPGDTPKIERWRDAEHFRSCVAHWAERMHVRPERIQVRNMTTKWASCSARGTVSFSTQLLKETPEFGEYVIVHELLHLKIPNHSKLFKSVLTAHLPDWKDRAAQNCDGNVDSIGLPQLSPGT